jgi:hypothetical protein
MNKRIVAGSGAEADGLIGTSEPFVKGASPKPCGPAVSRELAESSK